MTPGSWQKIWLVIYAIGLTLVPPISLHGKNFFAAELLLLPFVLAFMGRAVQGKITPPPRELLWVVAALLTALVAGLFRHELAKQLTLYAMPKPDHFRLGGDIPPFIRWTLIFATPWIIREVCDSKTHVGEVRGQDRKITPLWFLEILKYCVLVSAMAAVAEHFGLIDLVAWNYHIPADNWTGRSFGTSVTPLEAGLLYGATIVYLLTAAPKTGIKTRGINTLIALLCFWALLLTHCGTAFVSMVVTMVVWILMESRQGTGSARKRNLSYFLVASFVIAVAAGLSLVPEPILMSKWKDFAFRFGTWVKWVSILPQKPWILLTGIGFSGLIVDNSIVLLLIKGGLFLFISVGRWLKKLEAIIPGKLKYLFLFWALTWLTLDSLGYWGLGRLCWLLLGLCSSSLATDSAE